MVFWKTLISDISIWPREWPEATADAQFYEAVNSLKEYRCSNNRYEIELWRLGII